MPERLPPKPATSADLIILTCSAAGMTSTNRRSLNTLNIAVVLDLGPKYRVRGLCPGASGHSRQARLQSRTRERRPPLRPATTAFSDRFYEFAEPGEAACHYDASAKFWADSHREQALGIFVAMLS